jgi:hypothetical protein
MICSNPVLDQLEEIIRFRNNLFGLCMSCDGGVVVGTSVRWYNFEWSNMEESEFFSLPTPNEYKVDLAPVSVAYLARCPSF